MSHGCGIWPLDLPLTLLEPSSNSVCSLWLLLHLGIKGLCLLDLVSFDLHSLVDLSQSLGIFLVVNQLAHQKLSVIFLSEVLDLQLIMLFHQDGIVVIDFLSDLDHGF